MEQTEQFDAVIVGSGQGGNPLAAALARAGRKTALIERGDVGGTCINTGCTPTKTMVASARVAYLARRAGDYGVKIGRIAADMARVRERKRSVVASFRGGSEKRLEKAHVELMRGEASFTGPREIHVALLDGGERRLEAPWIFLDTGTRNLVPKIEGLESVPHLDNESIMELDRLPEHLLVLGGGYIGLEFAQMFRRFGSRVTIVQQGPQLLPREDDDIAEEVLGILREDGITVMLDAHTEKASRKQGKKSRAAVTLMVRTAGKVETVEGSDLLLAAGRTPNVEALNLAAAGVATNERGYIRVNERLETSAPGVYALGDVNGGSAFTHISYDDYRIVKANLLEGGHRTVHDRQLPYTLYIDPQLGRIGMTEKQAQEAGIPIRVAKMPMTSVARALETDETRGLMKVIVNAGSEEIVGAAILGLEGGELMSVVEVAMMGKLKYTALRDAVFAHPTLAESLNNLFFHFADEKN
jgi:pyruvate/2-oxoglutarate dehydrogenase complex dihydrolipoamide dehydrogenase (E3) component